uniref:Uncharacterized protein n=1 Tax=Lotus japonicus TaxID=34305 RepID=I3SQX0_LOTJA|nr:unknown [Lotus japonicus]
MTLSTEQDSCTCHIIDPSPRAWNALLLTNSWWQCWMETSGLLSLLQNH